MDKEQTKTLSAPLTEDDRAVLSLRCLMYDMCNQHGGGHGGSSIGMAAIGVALWKYTMRYNPLNSEWFDRDRFVLSNAGHASLFLYALNHLVGFPNWTMDELKGYASAKENGYETLCHGHPERQIPGIEVTTGPLGQGIANAVGLAIASKHLAAQFNRPSFDIIQSRIYCMTGDGCLMEGVALEAISLAGNLALDNLVLVYDNNAVTCDGPLDWINTEDVNAKFRASGWNVIDVHDGNTDVPAIVKALSAAKATRGKPTMINIRTVIGLGTRASGTYKAHHGAIDAESVRAAKVLAGQDPSQAHFVSESSLAYFRERATNGVRLEAGWNDLFDQYKEAYPDLADELKRRRLGDGKLEAGVEMLRRLDVSVFANLATRESNGEILSQLWKTCPSLVGGGADLVNSCKFGYTEDDVFHPSTDFKGRYVRYGIREHAMAGISNGIAAYSPSSFLPVTATFFMFYLYAAPSVRMGALSDLPVIHIATHDSFAEGQNGPTHQAVELDSLYRAMPNLMYTRPADAEEVAGAWILALINRSGPSMLSLGRDAAGGSIAGTDRVKVARGAYVVRDVEDPDLILVSCGTALFHAIEAAEVLTKNGHSTRVISAPSLKHFDSQSREYRDSIFPKDGTPIVSVEEYVATTWARYTTASIGMTGYGYSASGPRNYARFGLDKGGIVKRVQAYLGSLGEQNARLAGWQAI
ncbi:hypothetical protein CC79DRAFT_1269361 [Sarocladium strictum]